jgi:hypothetical protein
MIWRDRGGSARTDPQGVRKMYATASVKRLQQSAPGAQSGLARRCAGEAAEGTRTLDLLHGKQTL